MLLSLLPAVALLLHELGYLLARSACRADGELAIYITVGVAMIVSAGWSLALVPFTSRLPQPRRELSSTVVIATALLTIFLSQETLESLMLGDKPAIAQAALAILAVLCLALGALAVRISRMLCRAAAELVSTALSSRRHERRASDQSQPAYSLERGPAITTAPLAFRLASRPPPGATPD